MIIGFDFDGTLVETWTAAPLPGVRERLAELPPGARTFIATNQAGPVWRHMLGDVKYPSVQDVVSRIAGGLQALNWRPDLLLIAVYSGQEGDSWRQKELWIATSFNRQIAEIRWFGPVFYAASAKPDQRKPSPNMLHRAGMHFGAPVDCYIGDMQTDHEAAIAAGCRYLDAVVWRERGLADAHP